MQVYYKIFHYSSVQNLTSIDPRYYGSSSLNTKAREGGLNKSYFYTEDKPENCVRMVNRYEIYLPENWKILIYDIGEDKNNLYDQAKKEIEAIYHRPPYRDEVKTYIENYLYNNGYKGFINSQSILPHACILFYPITTAKPNHTYYCYDWHDNTIKQCISSLTIHYKTSDNFFNLPCKDINLDAHQLNEEKIFKI